MKLYNLLYTVLIVLILWPMPQAEAGNIFSEMFRGVKAQFSGDSEITDMEDGTFEVTYYAAASESRKEKHRNWRKLANKACNGSRYTVISKRYQEQVTVDQIIVGIIRCGGKSGMRKRSSAPTPPINQKVYQAQKKLASLGYDIVADGIMGKQTRAVIRSFQHNNELTVSEHLDAETVRKLNQLTRIHSTSAPQKNSNSNNEGRESVSIARIPQSDSISNKADHGVPTTRSSKIDMLERLKQLHQLKRDNIITDEEFTLLKKKIIDQL